MVSRLVSVKGIDDINVILDKILALGAQLIIVGDEDNSVRSYESFYKKKSKLRKGEFAYKNFNEELEFLTYAGSDILLMPSHDEACGTTQTNGMMYGVLPVVSMLSAFEDTITAYGKKDIEDEMHKGIGFHTYRGNCWVLLEVLKNVVNEYASEPDKWVSKAIKNMKTDFSWENYSIKEYLDLYNSFK